MLVPLGLLVSSRVRVPFRVPFLQAPFALQAPVPFRVLVPFFRLLLPFGVALWDTPIAVSLVPSVPARAASPPDPSAASPRPPPPASRRDAAPAPRAAPAPPPRRAAAPPRCSRSSRRPPRPPGRRGSTDRRARSAPAACR